MVGVWAEYFPQKGACIKLRLPTFEIPGYVPELKQRWKTTVILVHIFMQYANVHRHTQQQYTDLFLSGLKIYGLHLPIYFSFWDFCSRPLPSPTVGFETPLSQETT